MTTVTDKPVAAAPGTRHWSERLLVPEMWGALAIAVMWLAVLFDGVYGGDIVTVSSSGDSVRLPSAIVVALFAFLATGAVARRAFGRRGDSDRT